MERQQFFWILFLFVGIVGVLWFFLGVGREADGFQNPFRADEEAARNEGRYGTYVEDRTDYFHKKLSDKAIYMTDAVADAIPDLDKRIQQALETANVKTNGPPDPEYGRYIMRINATDKGRADFEFCRGIQTVEDLPTTGPSAVCGWLVVPDNTTGGAQLSLALPGTPAGPDPSITIDGATSLPTGSQWFWHTEKAAAIAAENAKKCARITTCASLDPRRDACAFNKNTGKGEPFDRNTGGTVPTHLVTRPENCPRQYNFCADGSTAEKRRECVRTLLDVEGIPAKAWLRTNVTDVSGQDLLFKQALGIVYERLQTPTDSQIPLTPVSNPLAGVADRIEPTSFRQKVQYLKRIANTYETFPRDLAQMICFGYLLDGRQFIPENYYLVAANGSSKPGEAPNNHGDFALTNLQRAWRKVGCQPAGSGYPTSIPTGLSFADIQARYQALHQSMFNAENTRRQREAIVQCINSDLGGYGVAAGPSASMMPNEYCNERGLEYFVFDGEGATAILLGRFYSSTGLLVDPKTRTSTNKIADDIRDLMNDTVKTRYTTVSYKMRTMVSVPARVVMMRDRTWTTWQQHRFQVNKVPLSADAEGRVILNADERNLLEIEWSGTRAATWGAPSYPYMAIHLDDFQLYQASTKPLVSLDFFREDMTDSNRVVELETTAGIQLLDKEGRTGLGWAGMSMQPIRLKPALRSAIVKIVSQRLWIPTTAMQCVLFRLEDQTTANYSETAVLVNGTTIRYTVVNGFETKEFEVGGLAEVRGAWKNVAIRRVMNPATNELAVEIYVNQARVGSSGAQVVTNEVFKRPLDVYILNIGFGSALMGWFHVYDRTAIGRVEGFQGSSSSSSSNILDILLQESEYDPQSLPPTSYIRQQLSTQRPNYMVSQVPNFTEAAAAAAPGPAAAAASSQPAIPTSTATQCPFDTISLGESVQSDYSPKAYYNQKFPARLEGTLETGGPFGIARDCEKKCSGDCVAYSFNATKGTCTTYKSLGNIIETEPAENTMTVILSNLQKDTSYDDLKTKTLKAIDDYVEFKEALKSGGVFNKLFRDTAADSLFQRVIASRDIQLASGPSATAATASRFKGIPIVNDPRSDKQIALDRQMVANDTYRDNKACLNGIYKKYAMN